MQQILLCRLNYFHYQKISSHFYDMNMAYECHGQKQWKHFDVIGIRMYLKKLQNHPCRYQDQKLVTQNHDWLHLLI